MIVGMTRLHIFSTDADSVETPLEDEGVEPLRLLGFATILLGAVTLGLYLGREIRFRYRFRRRTPTDFFSNAGDPIASAEYGMGV